MELNMSDSIKENCVKLVGLINQLESCLNKLNKLQATALSKLQVSPIFGFSKVSNAIESMAKERGDFCTHWDEGDNTVIIEKKNHTNYLITLNPGKTLFKVDRYLPDFNFTEVEILKTGPWIERFERFVENKVKEVESLMDTKKRMEHDNKFGEVDF